MDSFYDLILAGKLSGGGGGGGSSGATIVASGTFIGTGVNNITVPIGNKMAKTDCAIYFYISDDSVVKDNYYKFINAGWLITKEMGTLNLSSYNSNISPTASRTYDVDGATVNANGYWYSAQYLNNTTVTNFRQSNTYLKYDSSGFSIFCNQGNGSYQFPSGATYKWKVVYFGDSPETDIVEAQ